MALRVRLVVAFVATSLITLLAAALILVPSLENRLQHERVDELRQLARTARFGLRDLPEQRLTPGSQSVRTVLDELQRRTGGRVALYRADGESLADTDPERTAPDSDELEHIIDSRLVRDKDLREGVHKGEITVVTPVDRRHGEKLTLVLRKPLGDTHVAFHVVRKAIVPAALTGAVVALLLAFALSQRLLARLRKLRDDARALGERGLNHEVRVGRPRDEVGEVAAALESMRARLVAQDASRQTFLSTASHELRTPLATLQGTLELLHENLDDPDAVATKVDAALKQTHRLTALATDLLDLNRIDNDQPLAAEPVELAELAGVVGDEFGVRVDATPESYALADAPAVLRILRVLVDNARKYGGERVTIRIRAQDVRVIDDGPGLSADDRARVFARFERGPDADRKPGYGLGLAIARGLAERMGGTLEALDVPSGATFVLRLPAWEPVPRFGTELNELWYSQSPSE